MAAILAFLVFFVGNCLPVVWSFYLPGLAPAQYCSAEHASDTCRSNIPVFVNDLDSMESVITYTYNHFDFCTDEHYDDVSDADENLSQLLFGQRPRKSPIKLQFMQNMECEKLCVKTYNGSKYEDNDMLNRFKTAIYVNYVHHWIVDNMPVQWCMYVDYGIRHCSSGFPAGCFLGGGGQPEGTCTIAKRMVQVNSYYLFNHVDFIIRYHSDYESSWTPDYGARGSRILSVQVQLRTTNDSACGASVFPGPMIIPAMPLGPNTTMDIPFTYSVKFRAVGKMEWSSRWDHVLTTTNQSNVQWFTLLDTVITVLVLSALVAVVLMRIVRKDIQRYNEHASSDDSSLGMDDSGWKLIHGDVFRTPYFPTTLSIAVGSGTQVLLMTAVTIGFACFGFVNPEKRGNFVNWAVILYMALGAPAGYVAARLNKAFNAQEWRVNAVLTATVCPIIVLSVLWFLNMVLWAYSSSSVVSFGTFFLSGSLWLLVSSGMSLLGAFYANVKQGPMTFPTRVNQIPRTIGPLNHIARPMPGTLLGGILPFFCISVQLYFILSYLWSQRVFHMFGFLLIAFVLFVITSAETAILLCYYHLCAEDYRWWWRSFLSAGSTGLYVFFYSIHHFHSTLKASGFMPTVLFFGYAAVISFLCFLLTGAVGFLACFWFVRKIYSFVKAD